MLVKTKQNNTNQKPTRGGWGTLKLCYILTQSELENEPNYQYNFVKA